MVSRPQPEAALLTGRSCDHIIDVPELGCSLHREVVEPFRALRAAAAEAGIDLRAASAFRDFDRQLAIWNAKFRGERPVLDRQGKPIEISALNAEERIAAILAWSALPGASRHHWGTDIDVYDAAAMPEAARLQLVPQEYASDGPFARLVAWLDEHLEHFGFFRPYLPRVGGDRAASGVSPEPWHLSFAPLADGFLAALTPRLLGATLAEASLEGREVVLAQLEEIHRCYVANITAPPSASRVGELREHGRMI